MPSPPRVPCVIVGGGIAGVAAAAHLADLGIRGVVVLEREPRLGEGATGRSAGGIRQQFTDPQLVRAARVTVRMLETFSADTGVDPEFRRHGYLLLATDPDRARRLREEGDLQRGLGLAVETLGPDAVKERFPCLETGDVIAANFCGTDGYLSPHALVEGYRSRAQGGGAEFRTSRRVEAVEFRDGRVSGVRTAEGFVAADRVLVASGADAGPLLEEAGVPLPLRPTLRRIHATHPLPAVPRDLPLVLDLDKPFYFRPESGGVLLSLAEVEEGGTPERMGGTEGALTDRLVERALARCPLLGEARFLASWSGHRTLTPDDRPILGEAPDRPGLWLAVGFGGHGITHAPSLTRALAEEMVHGASTTLPLGPYRPNRPELGGENRPSSVL